MTSDTKNTGEAVTDLRDLSDEVLNAAVLRARRLIAGLSAADMADIRVARFEADSGASDRVLSRNFERTQGAKRALQKIENEIARRAARATGAA